MGGAHGGRFSVARKTCREYTTGAALLAAIGPSGAPSCCHTDRARLEGRGDRPEDVPQLVQVPPPTRPRLRLRERSREPTVPDLSLNSVASVLSVYRRRARIAGFPWMEWTATARGDLGNGFDSHLRHHNLAEFRGPPGRLPEAENTQLRPSGENGQRTQVPPHPGCSGLKLARTSRRLVHRGSKGVGSLGLRGRLQVHLSRPLALFSGRYPHELHRFGVQGAVLDVADSGVLRGQLVLLY